MAYRTRTIPDAAIGSGGGVEAFDDADEIPFFESAQLPNLGNSRNGRGSGSRGGPRSKAGGGHTPGSPASNPIAASFATPSTDVEFVTMWSTLIERYGGFDEANAKYIATQFADNDFPVPLPELVGIITHDDLFKVGVHSVGDRIKVLLAIKKAPPPVKGLAEAARVSTPGSRTSTSSIRGFNADPTVCKLLRQKPPNHAFEWLDLIGKDSPKGASTTPNGDSDYQKHVRKILSIFHDKMEQLDDAGHAAAAPPPMSSRANNNLFNGGAAPRRRGSVFYTGDNGDRSLSEEGAGASSSMRSVDPFDILSQPQPLPVFLVDTRQPLFVGFVLRVPGRAAGGSGASPGESLAEDSNDSVVNLTNRWVVFIDSRTNLIATIHRVDSSGLATLRDEKLTQLDSSVTLRQMILNIFVAFLSEFESAIDEVGEHLDQCELSLLDRSQASWVIARLLQLQRRVSVFNRLVDLNQVLIRYVGTHFSCRDMSDIETGFHDLRERCAATDARAASLLNLIMSLSGHRTTEVMTVLTKVSMCLAPCNLIAGIYGMNFEATTVREFSIDGAFYFTVAVMLMLIGMIWLVMKWLNW